MLDLWYKNAVIYCLDVDAFMDGNGDGIGDFRGLSDRLDHIEAMGVTTIWLMPFYPSPNRDNGYDISDFYSVDPRYGSLGDFVTFMRDARHRGMRVIIDLVVNHTSIDHPWFQAARSDPNSPFRDWYVWSKEKPADADEGVVFPGVQESTWTYDEKAGEYYFHRFYEHQADLNIANPAVREEIQKIIGFWLELGVSGFRVDAVPFLIEYKGLKETPAGDPHEYMTELRDFLSWRKAEAVLLAEANIPMDKVDDYFGNGDRMSMVFHFMLNQNTFLAFKRGEAAPIIKTLRETPAIPKTGQWGTFLRNHDELDLGRLSDEERQEVFSAFGPEKSMQVYDRGIRRRLAPMLGGDVRRLAMAYSLMFTLPGTPVIWYGDEIGMGEDLSLEERHPVRTPMQWDDAPNGGFSTAPAETLVRPVVTGGAFGYEELNVDAQRDDPASLLETIRRMVRERRSHPEIGWAAPAIIETNEAAVLALRYRWNTGDVVVLHNFADRPASVRLDVGDDVVPVKAIVRDAAFEGLPSQGEPINLSGYGYCWLELGKQRAR